MLFLMIAWFVISFTIAFLIGYSTRESFITIAEILSVFMSIGSMIFGIRRLHDVDMSGWFILIMLIPYVSILFAFYLWLAPGTVGYNRYGSDPLTY